MQRSWTCVSGNKDFLLLRWFNGNGTRQREARDTITVVPGDYGYAILWLKYIFPFTFFTHQISFSKPTSPAVPPRKARRGNCPAVCSNFAPGVSFRCALQLSLLRVTTISPASNPSITSCLFCYHGNRDRSSPLWQSRLTGLKCSWRSGPMWQGGSSQARIHSSSCLIKTSGTKGRTSGR